jgi:phage terminase large subunit-like protein
VEDDWLDEQVWHKANPGLGVTVKLDYLRAEANRAEQTPAYQNTFRRLHLNQWTQQETRWLSIEDWNACNRPIDLEHLKTLKCYAGLDLASSSDIAALVLVFGEEGSDEFYWVLPRFFIPQENMIERGRKDRVPYDAWVRDGFMIATEGNVIDYDVISREIETLGKQFNIKEIAFDPWGAVQLSQQLAVKGFEMVQFRQGFISMSQPTKELMRLIKAQRLAHGGQPVLRWMADNLVVSTDASDNLKPDKKKSREKIDGMVALVMGLARAIVARGATEKKPSVYETRGLVRL